MNIKPLTSKPLALFLIAGVFIVLAIVGVGALIFNPMIQTENSDKDAVTTTANELQFPPGYQVLDKKYFSSACLDVCPNITIRYKVADSNRLGGIELIDYLATNANFDQASPYIKHVNDREVRLEGSYCDPPAASNEGCVKVTL